MTVDPAYGLQLELQPKRPRWGPWATIGWGIVIAIAVSVAQAIAALAFIPWWNGTFPGQMLDLASLQTNGPLLGVLTLVSTVVLVGIVLYAVKLSHVPVATYLALKWPSLRHLLIGLLITAIMLPTADFVATRSGQEAIPDFMRGIYLTSEAAGGPFAILLAVTLIFLAPLGEEVLFRGFLFRGLNVGFGPLPAIFLTALLWAGMHVQYDPIFIAQIFVYGIIFGWLRWRSGSLILVILLHAAVNSLALVQTSALLGG